MKYVQVFSDDEKWYINENYIYSVSDIRKTYQHEGTIYPVVDACIWSWGGYPATARIAVNSDGTLKRFEF